MNIGDTYSWTPAAFEGASGICGFEKLRTAHGGIVYINERHRYFTAEADINGNKLRESFKF
jgi:hypothetical protein|nr:MAG TPA: hypothetical protein [Caudoviricetes sp.]